MTARSWTARSEGARPLTVNAVAGMHRMAWASSTEATRSEWGWLFRAAKLPRLAACSIVVTPLHKDRRSPQDPAACAPAAKAAIDSLMDIGVLVGDDGRYVRSVTFLPPRVCGVDGMELVVTEEA